MRLTLSLGLGIFVPGSGALAYANGDLPWVPIHASLADQGFFGQTAGIAFGLTLALMLEMRFAGLMQPREERERRMVFRWFVVGGFLTFACAVLGARKAPATQPSHRGLIHQPGCAQPGVAAKHARRLVMDRTPARRHPTARQDSLTSCA
jgi:hypothetical protein